MSLSAAVLRSSLLMRQQQPRAATLCCAVRSAVHQRHQTASFTSTTPIQMSEKKDELRIDDLVKTVAETHEITQAESRRIIDTVVDTIADALGDHKAVHLPAFGSFSTYTSKERNCRNPRTGEEILVPPKERIRFKPFTGLKRMVEK